MNTYTGEVNRTWLLTAGLNKPPLILKKTHALTVRENPKLKLIYSNSEGFFCATFVMTVVPVFVLEEMFATLQQLSSNQQLLLIIDISRLGAHFGEKLGLPL